MIKIQYAAPAEVWRSILEAASTGINVGGFSEEDADAVREFIRDAQAQAKLDPPVLIESIRR